MGLAPPQGPRLALNPASFPTGTVTFLFTDIEGSTRLLARLGERYADVLAEHRRLLREIFAAHEGTEMGTEGDAFFVAFPDAVEAVTAAAEAQLALEDTGVRVRMGVHTGEPKLTEDGYVGMDVHNVARICAAGHGGQVVLSHSTAERVRPEADLLDLGEHRLKDIPEPQRLYQIGSGEFPPLRTLHRTNLPIPSTPLLGRAADVQRAVSLLRRDDVRLLTLTGPAGSGKTLVALEAAAELVDEYSDGAFYVELTTVIEAEHVVAAIQRELETEDATEHLRDRHLLLVLDRFEHVRKAAPPVGDLLAAATALNVLVTSREPLGIPGERVHELPPLEPSVLELLGRS